MASSTPDSHLHEELASRSLSSTIGESFLFTFIVSLGTIGNIAVLLVLYRNHRLRNILSYFVISLAISDIIMLYLCAPFSIAVLLGLIWWVFGNLLCQILLSVFKALKVHERTVANTLRTGNTRQAALSLEDIRVTKILFATVVGFFLCWTPVFVYCGCVPRDGMGNITRDLVHVFHICYHQFSHQSYYLWCNESFVQ